MRRVLIPLLWLLAMLVCAWLAIFKTPVAKDITLFIPKTDTTAELLLEQLHSGPAARLILLGLEGGSEQTKAAASKRLAGQLRKTGLFARVANGEDLLDQDEQRRLFSYRYLLSPTVNRARFDEAGLRAALQQRLRELGSPLSTLGKTLLPGDPTGEFITLLRTWQGSGQPVDSRLGVWFSPAGERALLLAETHASGYDLAVQEQVVTVIKDTFAAVREAADIKLLLSGPGVFAVLSQDTIRHEAELLSTAASVFMVLIVLLAYRSVRPVLLSVLVLGSAVLVAVVTVGVLFGGIFGITLAFGITLLGEAVDYPILVFTQLHGHAEVATSVQRIWPTLRLCVATTVIGCLAMVAADFPGLAQLGVFTIAGLLTAAVFTRWVLPTLLPAVWAPRHTVNQGDWMLVLLRPRRSLAITLISVSLLILLALLTVAPPLWEDDLAALSPIPEDVISLDQELRNALGAPEVGHLIVITAADAETALQRSEAAATYLQARINDGLLSGFEAAVRYLPSQQTQRERQAALPERERLETNLDRALAGLPFKPGLFEPFLEAVEKTRAGPPLSPRDLHGTVLGLRVGTLLFEDTRGWTALLPLKGVRDPNGLAQGLTQLGYAGVYYLDMKAETNRLVAGFRNAALIRLGWGAALIVLVVWLGFRSWRLVLATLLPVCLAIIMDVGVLLWLGKRLSLFHLVSLLLVLGIGTNYGLFFSRPDPDLATRKRTLYGLLACSSSTLVVFGMLSLSTLPVLNAIGQTVAIGVFASFCMALTVAQQVSSTAVKPAAGQPGSGTVQQ